jgi:nucleotide-binding universal stress UspA family protein
MRVLVAVDNSTESTEALRYACHLLEGTKSWVETIYVKPNEAQVTSVTSYGPFVDKSHVTEWLETEAEEVREQVLNTCDICLEGKTACWPRIAVGDPTEEIIATAEARNCDMIVLGSQGRSAFRGFLLGAVHAKILHHARQPVLIVRSFRPIHRILVAYRGSHCDQGALEFLAHLLGGKKPEITVVHVQETEMGESTEFAQACLLSGDRTLRQLEHEPVTKMAAGDFVDEILREVATGRYDLIVLGAYGHDRPRYLKILSDEALNLVRLTSRPVLVFRDKTAARND